MQLRGYYISQCYCISTCSTVQDAFSQMSAKCAFCLFFSRIISISEGENISSGSQRQHELAHNRGIPISVECKDVAYTVQRLTALHGQRYSTAYVLPTCSEQFGRRYQVRGWHSDRLSTWRLLLCYIPHFDQVIQSNSRLRLLYFKSLHAIRELVCVW